MNLLDIDKNQWTCQIPAPGKDCKNSPWEYFMYTGRYLQDVSKENIGQERLLMFFVFKKKWKEKYPVSYVYYNVQRRLNNQK